MTLNELGEYIDTLNKPLSQEDLLEVCRRHKECVAQKDKSWAWLAGKVNYPNGENLRNWYKRHKNDVMKTDKDVRSKDDIEKEILYKERQKNQDVLNSYRRSLRDEARVESFVEALKTSVGALGKLPVIKYTPTSKACENEAIMMFSDLHLGADCSNFYNKYNVDIARKRVKKYTHDVIEYCHANNVKRLDFLNMGDLIHGLIHTSARIESTLDVTEQIITASEILAECLNELQEACEEVVYRSVVDNHSRAIANKDESIEKENFSRIIDWFLKERLKDTKIIFANDNLDMGIGKFTLMNGKNVMFAHGHNDTINRSYQNFTGATEQFIHYILLAHYHSEKCKNFQNARVIVNGSIVGTEDYALSKRLFSKPSQKLLVFDKDNLLDISINLDIM